MSRINIPRLKTCTRPRYECQIWHITVFRAAKIIKDISKAPLFQLMIQMKKVIMKEQDQQYRYVGYYVKMWIPKTVLFHGKPKRYTPLW